MKMKFDACFQVLGFFWILPPFKPPNTFFFEIGGSSHKYFSFRSISHPKRKLRKEGESMREKHPAKMH